MAWDQKNDPLGRKADVERLQRGIKHGNRQIRESAAKSLDKIKGEAMDPSLRAARQALVKAVHDGDTVRREEVENHIADRFK